MKQILTLTAILLSCGAAFAGTLAFSGSGAATVTPTGASLTSSPIPFQLSTYSFQSGNAVKIQGDETFTYSGGGSATIIVGLTGSGNANSGDFLSVGYDFTLQLTGGGTVTPTANMSALLLGVITVNKSGQLAAATSGTSAYTGSFQTPTAPVGGSATFSADTTFLWTGGTAGDTLRITIPSNSIDYALAPTPVPEPGSAGLLLIGAAPLLALALRRF